MIVLSHITKSYIGRKVVCDLDFTVDRGVVFGFLGPNGAGKTTTIKMLAGLAKPDDGSITIDNGLPADPAVREKIGFMPEDPYFYDHLTAIEFLALCDNLFPHPRSSISFYQEILDLVGLKGAQGQKIHTYSKGMKQRLGFAQAVINDPEYLFLDEPLDGLDPIGRREIKAVIKDLKARGTTIFFNSHVLFDVEEVCDQIGIIHKGRLLYKGGVDKLCAGKSLEQRFVEMVEAVDNDTNQSKENDD